jgi:uncharacterized FlaG/YvyC family protein
LEYAMIETIKIGNLALHPSNDEMWGTLDVNELTETIRLSGQVTPLLVSRRDNGSLFVLGGNRRLKASISLGIEELDCRVLEGLSPDQEEDHLFWDNHSNRGMSGDGQIRAALRLIDRMAGTQKQKIEELSRKTSYSIPKCKKIFATAVKLAKAVAAAGENGQTVKNKALENAKLHGISSKTVENSVKPKSEKSSDSDDKSVKNKVTKSKTDKRLSRSELEAKIVELQTLVEKRRRRMQFLLDSFGENEVWIEVLTYMDQKISLSDFNRHIGAGEPHPDKRIHLDVWSEDLSESILQDYFVLFCNGRLIEKTNYIDVVEPEFSE